MSPDEREPLQDPARLLAAALAIRLFLTAHPPGWDADWFRQTLATAWLWIGLCLVVSLVREAGPTRRSAKRSEKHRSRGQRHGNGNKHV